MKPNNGGEGKRGNGEKMEKFGQKKSYRRKREKFKEEKQKF